MEGIFLVFAMNNIVSIPIHTLLLSAGTLLPIISVVCILAFSISSDEQVTSWEKKTQTHLDVFQVYLSRYTADRIFLQPNIATIDDIDTVCWLRPDYVMKVLNIPVGLILLSNLTVLITAVATAYRSATFRWVDLCKIELNI